jgi:prepilin-type processing-associated H-X9-DG protein
MMRRASFIASISLFAAIVLLGDSQATAAKRRADEAEPKIFLSTDQWVLDTSTEPAWPIHFRMRVQLSPDAPHPGGVNFLFGDGSVRTLHAASVSNVFSHASFRFGVAVDLLEKQGRDYGPTWTILILPYLEQDNLYSFTARSDAGDVMTFLAKGRFLPDGRDE